MLAPGGRCHDENKIVAIIIVINAFGSGGGAEPCSSMFAFDSLQLSLPRPEQSHGHSFHVSCQYPSNSSMKHRGRGSQLSFVRPSGLVACFPVFSVKMPLPLRSEGCWGDNVAWDAPNPRTHRRVSPWSWIGQHRARIPRSDNASARKKDTRVVMHCRERALMCGSRWLRGGSLNAALAFYLILPQSLG